MKKGLLLFNFDLKYIYLNLKIIFVNDILNIIFMKKAIIDIEIEMTHKPSYALII